VFIFTQPCGSRCYLNNLPAMRPGPREAGKQSGRSFATATLCFYKPRQGVLFDPSQGFKGSNVDSNLMLFVRTIMVIRRTLLRLVGFSDEYRSAEEEHRI
jgi:hypothetical protein